MKGAIKCSLFGREAVFLFLPEKQNTHFLGLHTFDKAHVQRIVNQAQDRIETFASLASEYHFTLYNFLYIEVKNDQTTLAQNAP